MKLLIGGAELIAFFNEEPFLSPLCKNEDAQGVNISTYERRLVPKI